LENYRNTVSFPVDVKVENEAYVLEAYLPGVQLENLNIQVVNDTVTIEGELKNSPKEDETYLLQECQSGHFSRSLTLPDELDTSKAEASLKDGVLTLKLPKVEAALPKTIKVVGK
jgi:HSP20 family protein